MKTFLTDLPAACQAFLDGRSAAAADHAQACAPCAQQLRLRAGLGAALGAPPTPPAALRSPAFLAGVHERIVADVERTSGIATELATPARAPADIAAPVPALAVALGQALGRSLRADGTAWIEVRQAVFAEISGRRVRRRRFGLLLGLAGAAAVVAALPFLVELGAPTTVDIDIAFADLDRAPDGDFVAVRSGLPR